MPKKPAVLRDWVMSSDEIDIEFVLKPNHSYYIGRDPPLERGYCPILVLYRYNPQRHPNKDKEERGRAVSKLQGKLKLDERGNVYFTQESENSSTYLMKESELKGKLTVLTREIILHNLVHLLDETHRIYAGVTEQLFTGDFLVFGGVYPMQYIGNVDSVSEESLKRGVRKSDTEVIKIPEEFLKRL